MQESAVDESLERCPAFNALQNTEGARKPILTFPKCLPAEGKIAVFNSCETSACSAGSSTKLSYSKFLAGCRDAELPPCPLLAQSGHCATEFQCPLSGVKRTFS